MRTLITIALAAIGFVTLGFAFATLSRSAQAASQAYRSQRYQWVDYIANEGAYGTTVWCDKKTGIEVYQGYHGQITLSNARCGDHK